MDKSLKETLAYANRMKIFNNQLRLLKEKYSENNIYYTQGHQFTVDLQLINHCITLINLNKHQNAVLLDDYRLPVQIQDLKIFYDEVIDIYQQNMNAYLIEYQALVNQKGGI